MIALLMALTLMGGPPRHATPVVLPHLPIVSVAQPVQQPKAQNARQRKLIARGCIKVALHEWICPMPRPKHR